MILLVVKARYRTFGRRDRQTTVDWPVDSPPKDNLRPRVAPAWHTLCVLALLAILAALLAFLRMGSTTARLSNLGLYPVIIVCEWAIFAFTLRRSDTAFAGYIGAALRNPRALLWDVPLAVLLAAILVLISPVLVHVLGETGWVSTQGMLPKSALEIAVWIVMAITAGICEETIFRGYLQQQITGWTGYVVFGIVGQALLFALCHAYQGWKNVALISVWGCVFGVFAWLRKGLRANMIAHAALDIFSGF
jgi:uncharacterized protein